MKDSTQLPWSTEEEFYDLHTNKFFSKDKFYHVYIIGSNDKEFADYIISKLNLTPESKVVDLGCGSGYLVSEISKICECIGISTSKQSIKKAKENYPGCKFEVASMEDFSIKNVTHFLSLETIGYTNIDLSFKNIYSNLVEGGVLYLKDISYISKATVEEKENLTYWENYWKYSTLTVEDMVSQGYKSGFKLNLFRDLSDDPRLDTSQFLKSLNENLVKENYPHPNIYVHIGTEFIFQKKKREEWTNPYI